MPAKKERVKVIVNMSNLVLIISFAAANMWIREAAKKVIFLVARPLRPLAPRPLPSALVAIGNFFLTLKRVIFSLVAHPFSPPPPLSGPAIKNFFAASLNCD